MARKSIEVPKKGDPPLPGRDAGKVFIVTEMSAWDAEAWGEQAYGCMVRAKLAAPTPGVLSGMAAIAVMGVSAFMAAPWAEVKPLLDEMIAKCVKTKEEAFPLGRDLTEDDVEEVQTILRLREEAVKLHTDFSIAANVLAAVVQAMTWMDESSSNTLTFREVSERLSALEKLVFANFKPTTRRKTTGSSSKSSPSTPETAG